MENFNQIFTLLAKSEGIGLNLDILETGLINIIALVAILVYTGKDFLGSSLQERKDTIVKSIQDAEDRLSEANKRLSEAQKQLSQAHVVITNIQNETKIAKTDLLKSDANIAKKELTIRFNRAISTFRSKQQKLFDQLKLKIVLTVLSRTVLKAKETFGTKKRSRALINETIQKIERKEFIE
jgi:F-type H+-transporting ATPase subunit b